jgi:hypothetical protein
MTGDIHSHLARVLVDDRLRAARARQAGERPARREQSAREAHAFQRALVRASLLVSRRDDGPADGRPA